MTADQITTLCAAQLGTARSRVESVLDRHAVANSPLDDLVAIETAIGDLEDALMAPVLLATVSDDAAIREASAACNQLLASFEIDRSADSSIYDMARAAHENASTPVDRQLAKIYMESGLRSGAALDTPERDWVKDLRKQLGRLEMEYMQALGAVPTQIEISHEESATLSDSFVKTLQPTPSGYLVPVHFGTYERFLIDQGFAEARRRFYLAFYNRGGQANVERLEQALSLRHELGQLLGFESWAAYRLDNKMAKTPERVLTMLTEVAGQLLAKAHDEIQELARLKRATGDNTPFAAWDFHYYSEQLARSRFGVDHDVIRAYFPADVVVPAVMKLYGELFGLRFEHVPAARSWAPEVQEYVIVNTSDGQRIGRFFLDLIPRPGKALHFAFYRLRSGRELPGGQYQTPVAAIIGNGPAAEPGATATFSHRDVLILFHEFGHLMHDVLSNVPYPSINGTNVRDDFVEAPSQMLENWVWLPEILAKISRHVITGEPLPFEIADAMIKRKHMADGSAWTRQAFFGIYDLRIHNSGPDVDTTKMWLESWSEFIAVPPVRGTIPQASFAGFMGGYDVGYYGYLWSKIYALDMFTEFQRYGVENPAVGARFRRRILEPGGSREPLDLVENFLARPPSRDAFYAELGLRPSSQ